MPLIKVFEDDGTSQIGNTITLSATQWKVFKGVARLPVEWIENAILKRLRDGYNEFSEKSGLAGKYTSIAQRETIVEELEVYTKAADEVAPGQPGFKIPDLDALEKEREAELSQS